MKLLFTVLIVIGSFSPQLFAQESVQDLFLAKDGETSYQIVTSAATAKDVYNAEFLAGFLKAKTGAVFPVVTPAGMSKNKNSILIGLSDPMRKCIGKFPYIDLENQDHVMKSIANDIILYGKGFDADFYAIMDFLNIELGCRWYQRKVPPKIEQQRTLKLKPFNRKRSWDFKNRIIGHHALSDYYRGDTGIAADGQKWRVAYGYKFNKQFFSLENKQLDVSIVPEKKELNFVHTAFGYIPNGKKHKGFEWIENSDYFKTNPEFFSMDKNGQRVSTQQLCFSNPQLRKEFTQNIEKHFSVVGTDNVSLSISYDDTVTTRPCYCKECRALEKKYNTPGAALFDYLLEIGEQFKLKHPFTTLTALLYRRTQTQPPPELPLGKKFPDNISFIFAPVSKYINRDWNHPDNKGDFEDLKKWAKLTNNITVWRYYPSVGQLVFLPFVNTSVMVSDMRQLKSIGVDGIFFEHSPDCTGFAPHYQNFSDLLIYFHYLLTKDVNTDVSKAITEFMDQVYGPAAKLAEKYHNELDFASTTDNKFGINLSANNFDYKLSYLSLERLYRWEKMFDEMEKLIANHEPYYQNIRNLRRAVDCAVYGRWNELAKAYPEYFKDSKIIRKRIGQPEGNWTASVTEYLNVADSTIKYAGKKKPLPEQFRKISKFNIIRKVPKNLQSQKLDNPRTVDDPDSAFGYAASIHLPDLPFHFGFYQTDKEMHGPKVTIEEWDIIPEKYQLFHLGEIQPTPDCVIWFSSKSWSTMLKLNYLYDLKETDAKYDAWVSLKFPENFTGKATDLVLCDQIILVKK